jgi:UDP-glucose 4-epimerase
MKRVLITGIAGFIGSHLAHALRNEYEIVGIDNLVTGDRANLHPSFNFIEADCSSYSEIKKLMRHDFDIILHFAGQSSAEISFRDPSYDLTSNALSTLRLLELGEHCNTTSFVYASSVTVYPKSQPAPYSEESVINPFDHASFYALSKSISEQYLRLYSNKMHTTSVRMFNIYGPAQNLANPDQGMLSIYLSQLLLGTDLLVKGSLERQRDFVHVFDVVDIVLKIIKLSHQSGHVINISTGIPTSVSELISLIASKLDIQPCIKVSDTTPGDTFAHWGENRLATRLLHKRNWISLEEGLENTIQAYRDNNWFSTRYV